MIFLCFSNWKIILPFTLAILLFSAAFFTKKDITFAVNIWIFPGKQCLCFSANLAIKYNPTKNIFFNKTLTSYFYLSQSRAKRPIIQLTDAQAKVTERKKIPRKTWLRVRIGIMNVRAFGLKYDHF